MLSVSLFSCSGELATKANDKSLSLRIVVQASAPFFVVPSCTPKRATAKLWPERMTDRGKALASLLWATHALILASALASSRSATALRGYVSMVNECQSVALSSGPEDIASKASSVSFELEASALS